MMTESDKTQAQWSKQVENKNRGQAKASRREFFLGKFSTAGNSQLADSAAISDHPAAGADARSRPSAYWEQYSSRAMACEFELLFHLQQHAHSTAVAAEVFQLIADLEDQLTVYRSHSEISRINREAHHDWVAVEPKLFGLLETAIDLSRKTGGAFDMTSAVLTKLWQFDQRAGALPEPHEIQKALANIGSEQIELDLPSQRLRYRSTNLQINLGAIGKGYAIDRAAERIRAEGIEDFAIHGGQSSVLAWGSEALPPDENGGWWIGLSHPIIPTFRLGTVRVANQALGTSGTARQGFFHRGVRYGHIIDPRTGWPAANCLSTTVVTNSAALSDALATAFFVMSIDQVTEYCAKHPDVKALVLAEPEKRSAERGQLDGNTPLLVQSFNFEESDLQFFDKAN